MQAREPTTLLLDGRPAWPTGANQQVSVGPASGIRLAADPHGPLSPRWRDGSFGGLAMPRGMALDERATLHLLDETTLTVKRFDPSTGTFAPLPTVGGPGRAVRRFRCPTGIAIVGESLYVADAGNMRVQVFELGSLALLHIWRGAWVPVDVAAQAGAAYILDRRFGRVYRHNPRRDGLRLVIDCATSCPASAGRWSRIAVDRDGHIYLWNVELQQLEIFDGEGRFLSATDEVGGLRERFAPPPIRLDHRERFCLPASLTRPCERRAEPMGAIERPLAECLRPTAGGLLFERTGAPAQAAADEPSGRRLYRTEGVWFSQALDSRRHRCQWHRIELELAALPPGARVTVSTYSADDPAGVAIDALPDHFWATGYTVAGAGQAVGSAPPEPAEFLVQSRPGRYLWLRLKLSGDGFTTPAVRSVRVHYPRDSYLDHLPAVFASYDEEGRWFLERLLAICQTEWDELERWIDDTPGLFDPRAVPAGPPLAELARWLALPLEETWDDEERRQLLIEAPRLRTQRGTLEGLKAHLRIYLRKLAGLAPEQPCNFPQIIEGFRERQRAMLGGAGQPLGAAPLWGPAEVGRLQSDRFAREGEARLVSVGEPEDDLFRIHAHRFRVYLPAAWVRDADAEAMLRRAIDGEKPAGTCYELCFVEPRLRVGVQSLLGLDTLIGSYTTARLTAAPAEGAAPNPTPQGRLGDGSMLPASAARPPGTRVDRDTCLH